MESSQYTQKAHSSLAQEVQAMSSPINCKPHDIVISLR